MAGPLVNTLKEFLDSDDSDTSNESELDIEVHQRTLSEGVPSGGGCCGAAKAANDLRDSDD